jgi:putative cardiolipin synthase
MGKARPELPEQMSIVPGEGTELDRLIAGPEAAHAGQSGFRLIGQGPEAFAIRARSALLAGRSLDVQTYIPSGTSRASSGPTATWIPSTIS